MDSTVTEMTDFIETKVENLGLIDNKKDLLHPPIKSQRKGNKMNMAQMS